MEIVLITVSVGGLALLAWVLMPKAPMQMPPLPDFRPAVAVVAPAPAWPINVNNRFVDHAVDNHGALDVEAIRLCTSNTQNIKYVYTDSKDKSKLYLLCRLPDGRWGLRVIFCAAKAWFEKTAFLKARPNGTGEGELDVVKAYVQKLGKSAGGYDTKLGWSGVDPGNFAGCAP